MSKATTILSWTLQVIVAAILFQTLFFKFTGAAESVYIFSTLGMEPAGRIGSGIVELIAATTTRTGLSVACEVDATDYQKGIKVTAAEIDSLSITRDNFHPEWNYTISPQAIDRAVILA